MFPIETFKADDLKRKFSSETSQAKVPAGRRKQAEVSKRKIPQDCKRKIFIERFQATISRRKNQLAGAAGQMFLSERSRKVPSERSQANDLKRTNKRKIPQHYERKFPSERSYLKVPKRNIPSGINTSTGRSQAKASKRDIQN